MKKLVKLLTVLALSVLMLAGCGEKEPTAEELVNGAFSKDNSKVMDIDIGIIANMSAKSNEGGTDVSMNFGLSANLNGKFDEDTSYLDGNVNISILGMDIEQPLKQYVQNDGDSQVTYSYDANSSTWTYEESAIDTDSSTEGFDSVNTSIFDSLVLQESSKEDKSYTVIGELSMKKVMETLGKTAEDADELMGSLSDSDINLENVRMTVVMNFDKESKAIQNMVFAVLPDTFNTTEEVKLNELSINVTFNHIGEDLDVTVPDDVKNNSIHKSADSELSTDFSGEWHLEGDDVNITTEEPSNDWDYVNGEWVIGHPSTSDDSKDKSDLPSHIVDSSEISDDWTDMEFTIDGVKHKVGDKLSSFEVNDWEVNSDWTTQKRDWSINPTQNTDGVWFLNNNYDKYFEFMTMACNNTEESITLMDCVTTMAEFSMVDGFEPVEKYPEVVFAKGITWGSSYEDVINAYGEPYYTYDATDYGYKSYSWENDNYELSITIYDDFGVAEMKYRYYNW